VDVKDPNL
jgi:superfamily II DNA/RNA helicase